MIGLGSVSLHAIAPEQALVWDATDRLLSAEGLLAPLVPELSALTPSGPPRPWNGSWSTESSRALRSLRRSASCSQ
ncbi:hypothetical protein GCM10009602_50680 [Nocardiopsis tropica]